MTHAGMSKAERLVDGEANRNSAKRQLNNPRTALNKVAPSTLDSSDDAKPLTIAIEDAHPGV